MANWNNLLFAGKWLGEWLFTNFTTLRNSKVVLSYLPYLFSESRGQVRLSRPDLRRVSQVEDRAQPRRPHPFSLSPLYVCSVPSSCSIIEKTKKTAVNFGPLCQKCQSVSGTVWAVLLQLRGCLSGFDISDSGCNKHGHAHSSEKRPQRVLCVRKPRNAASTSRDVKWRHPEDLSSFGKRINTLSPLQENFMFPNIYSSIP